MILMNCYTKWHGSQIRLHTINRETLDHIYDEERKWIKNNCSNEQYEHISLLVNTAIAIAYRKDSHDSKA